jgi:hypothetical protein
MTTDPTALTVTDPMKEAIQRSTMRTPWLCRAPLLIAAILICLITSFNLVRLVSARAPRDPWEATEVMEAWRSFRGMPVYEIAPDGHSTHVYGSLVPWVQGEIFRWAGPNNVSGRVLSLVSALALVALLAVTMRGDRSTWYLLIALAAFLGVNHRSGQYFAENRPDLTALLFAAAGMLLIGLGQERRRWLYVALGSASLVAGFFFKQTAFIFAGVPFVALVLRWRRPTSREIALALFPLAVAVAVVFAIRHLYPTIYYYMFDSHTSFRLNGHRTARMIWDLLLDSPLFLVLLTECVVFDLPSLRDDPRVRWLIAVLIVAIPYGGLTAGKVGGWCNSLLPALFPMMAFCVLRLPRLLQGPSDSSSPRPARLLLGGMLACFLLMSTYPHMSQENNLLAPRTSFELEYDRAVSWVARLPGKVVCPEDPTIPLYAKGFAGRSVFAERDTRPVNGKWPTAIPDPVLADCRAADYVVDVSDYFQDPLKEHSLRTLGFEPAPGMATDLRCYHIWRRRSPGPTMSFCRMTSDEIHKDDLP